MHRLRKVKILTSEVFELSQSRKWKIIKGTTVLLKEPGEHSILRSFIICAFYRIVWVIK
jgi:hypothetical protein